jgi:hypothetical protein
MELLVCIGCAAGDDLHPRAGVGCSTRTYRLRRRIGSPNLRSSLLISTTKGILFGSTVPNSGIDNCQAERISSSIAYNPSVNSRFIKHGTIMLSME